MQSQLECCKKDQPLGSQRGTKTVSEHESLLPPAYEEILTHVHDVLVANAPWLTDVSRRESARSLSALSQKVQVCGSEKVTKAFLILSRAARAYATAPSLVRLGNQLWALEDLLLAIRDDLGHENGDLKRGALLPLFVSDFGKFLSET